MNQLALDLQEATSDLLEVPAAWEATRASAAPSAEQHVPKATYSASSRLTLLDSDDDETPDGKQSKPRGGKKKQSIQISVDPANGSDLQAVHGDADNNEPDAAIEQFASLKIDRFGSLSSLTPPIRSSSAFRRSPSPSDTRPCPSPSLSSAKSDILRRAAAASTGNTGRTRRTAIPDVWLNERGERVVDGQVVGKLSVAAQKDMQREGASSARANHDEGLQTPKPQGESGGSFSATEATSALSTSSGPEHSDTKADTKRIFDHMHGSQSRNSTPTFFTQSFPDAIPGMGSHAGDGAGGSSSVATPTQAETSPESSSSAAVAQGRPSPIKPSQAPAMFRNLSASSTPAKAHVTGATSDPVKLHGNRRARERAMLADGSSDIPAVTPDDTPRPSDDHERRPPEATYAWDAHALGGEHGQSTATSVGDDTLESIEGDSASSLLSLTASSVTGDAASQRASLRRTASSGSAASSSRSRHGRRPSQSKSSGELFARDVRIRGWSEVGGRARGYVIFDVAVLTTKGVTIRVHRRFSSFVALRADLAKEAPQHRLALPALPPRDALHKFSAKHLERRRIALSDWLQAVVLDARWGGRRATREWLVGSE